LRLKKRHAGLPAGTRILVAVVGRPARLPARRPRKKHARPTREPLTVTPPLSKQRFVFPVVGPTDYGDSYGAFRGDVPGRWHHGDDLFAPLGTPVVAVASGTINRVGWERLGGWRLWVRDRAGDQFYYAHLSGYAPTALRSNRVEAGDVIGFIGNTGDAFTTSPHLHFEVHPRPLLHLAYDGAVNPTTYLNSWPRLEHVDAPDPAHPPLPRQPLIRKEARFVFRELLAARHLIKNGPKKAQRPNVPAPADGTDRTAAPPPRIAEAAPVAGAPAGTSTLTFVLAGLGSLALVAGIALTPTARRRFRG
jgi:hypothetical protein